MRAVISFILFVTFCSKVESNCIVSLRSFFPTPLFVEPTRKTSFHNPLTHAANLAFSVGDKFVIACPGVGNAINILNVQEAEVKCEANGRFTANRVQYRLEDLKCKTWPKSVQRNVGNCGKSLTLVQTAFNVASNFIPVMDTCFDGNADRTLYTKSTLSQYAGLQKNVERPDKFEAGHFFTGVNPDTMYNNQKKKFDYLGPKARTYFGGSEFFNHGHLSAKSDYEFGAQQRSTFWLTNAPPQWASFNGGNWEHVEKAVRNYAARNHRDLTVYTGTHGTLSLVFERGTKNIFMHAGPPSKVPVPQYFWKVVIEPVTRHAVAFIGFNNPYLTAVELASSLRSMCADVCQRVTWLPIELNQANRRNVSNGYIFCCDVNVFRTIVREFPDQSNYALLTSQISSALSHHSMTLLEKSIIIIIASAIIF